MLIITRTNQAPKVRFVSVVCMQGNLGRPTHPPNLKTTLIINKNSSLDFGIHVDYSARSSLKERIGARNFKFISVGGRATYTHFSDPEISLDLYRSQRVPDRRFGGGGKLPPLPPVATPMLGHDVRHDVPPTFWLEGTRPPRSPCGRGYRTNVRMPNVRMPKVRTQMFVSK